MSVSSVSIADANGDPQPIAARDLLGAYYQMDEPEVLTHHRVATGSDAVSILAAAGVLRAVRVFNIGTAPIYVKFHNTASTPSAGTGVVYVVPCQAGTSNPDPRVSAGGRAFSSGIGMTIVAGIADANASAVTAATVTVEVEYHAA